MILSVFVLTNPSLLLLKTQYFKRIGSSFSFILLSNFLSWLFLLLVPVLLLFTSSLYVWQGSEFLCWRKQCHKKGEWECDRDSRRNHFSPLSAGSMKWSVQMARITAECGRDGALGKKVYHFKFRSWHVRRYSHLLPLDTFPHLDLMVHKCIQEVLNGDVRRYAWKRWVRLHLASDLKAKV